MSRTVITPEIVEKINALYNEGLNLTKVAEALNISCGAVHRHLDVPQRRTWKVKNRAEKKVSYNNTVVEKYKMGDELAITEINKGQGCNAEQETREGKVVFAYDSYFTIQFKNYKESFKYSDILCKDVEVRRVA